MTAAPAREYKSQPPNGRRPALNRFDPQLRFALLLRLFVMLAVLACSPVAAFAQAAVTPRGAEHDTFGRMVFDWNAPIQWSAELVNGQLVVRFEKPMAGDPKALLKPLGKYLKGVTLSPDRRMATFSLAMPVQVKSFVIGTSTVIDLSESKAATAAQTPAPLPTPPPAPAPAATAPAKAVPGKGVPATDVTVRGGEHGGFNRLVFDWPKPVGYTVSVADGQAVIAFDQPANVNVTSLEAALPSDVRFVEARPQGKGTAVVLSVPPGTTAKHFLSGPKVAVDLLRPPPGAQPAKTALAPPPPAASPTPPGAKPEAPKVEPAKPEAVKLDPPKPEAAKAESPKPEPAKPELPKIELPKVAATAPAAPPAPPAPAVPAAEEKAPGVSLGVGFDQPSGAAAFRRAGWLWLVFDRRAEIDTKLLKRTGGDVVLHVEQVPGVRNGTAIRLITKPGYNPTVRKEGQLWVFDLAEQPLAPKYALPVNRQFDFEERGRLLVSASDVPGQAVVLRDPEVGDTLQVMPLTAIGSGVREEIIVPGADLLPTAQGVALVPMADGAHMEPHRQGIEVSMPGGLHLSRSLPAADGAPGGAAGAGATGSAETTTGGPLDIARWNRGGADKFVSENQKLLANMAFVRPEEKNIQRLEIARHYLANAMPAEALGILRLIAATDPAQVETPNFRGLRGVGSFLMLRDSEAIDDLSHASLAKDPQAQLWLAAAKARATGDLARNGLLLRLAPEEIKPLTPRLRMALGKVAAQATATSGDFKAANRIIEAMNGPGLSKRDLGAISYLQGLAADSARSWDQAIAKYREAEEGESRPDRAYGARARIELQLKRNLITTADAINQLNKLRFAWRGEDFEYTLVKRLGELMLADGQHAEGLRLLRSITANYADNPDVGSVQAMMSEAFEKLFLGGVADKLSPIAAIGLYDEFQELTPSGAKGDEMIRKLADRLASVDLLDRASDLLRHQVQFRVQGPDKARIGARLAFLELSDRKPAQALESLDMSETPDQPADLYDQRRYMRVRALAEQGRAAEALALIINDHSDAARQLRAGIYWDMKKWPEAATALEATLEKPEGNSALPPATARRVIDLATALTLARDERGLQRLRRTWGPRMNASEYRDAFELLTAEAERGVIDYRRINEKIKQAENFQTFMSQWRSRMQTQGLSSIN